MYNSKRTYEAKIVSRFLADHNGGRIGSGGGVEFQHVAVFDKINLIESTRKFAGVQRGLPPPPLFSSSSSPLPFACRSKHRKSGSVHIVTKKSTAYRRHIISRFRVITTDDTINSYLLP